MIQYENTYKYIFGKEIKYNLLIRWLICHIIWSGIIVVNEKCYWKYLNEQKHRKSRFPEPTISVHAFNNK